MPAPLLLAGSAGLGRETLAAVRAQAAWTPVGFLDDDPSRTGSLIDGLPVVGPLDAVRDHPDATVVLTVGKGAARLAIADRLAGLGVGDDRYACVVHPSASVGSGCLLGAGTVLLAGVVLTAAVTTGRHVVAMPGVVLTHDDLIADGVTLCAGVVLGGGVTVGRAAYLGMRCAVRENLTVGAGAVVGMGAVVLHDVDPATTVVGVPAHPLRTNHFTSDLGPDRATDRATNLGSPTAVGDPIRSPEGT
jgi:sugar O-acyltransferase (sialic acid O-acetyltransferase NeuD family)